MARTWNRLLTAVVLMAMVAAILPLLPGKAEAAPPNVWINEINYHGGGGFPDKFVEVAGPAGIVLFGWTLALYDGATGAQYGTGNLGSGFTNMQDGYGVVALSVPSIEAGDPDGIALVDPGGAVIEFVSYGGAFTAVGGPADGLTSADVGVIDPGSTPTDLSIQRTGVGTIGTDFSWTDADPHTFAAINTGQTFAASPGDLVINEIMKDPAAVGDLAGEWFEVYNPTGAAVDMSGMVLGDDGVDSHTIGSSVVVPAGGYVVLGNNGDTPTNGGVELDYAYSGYVLDNDDDEVVILDGVVEIDRVGYDGGATFPDPTGASLALSDTALDNDVGVNWCTSATSFGDGDLGSPGAANDCDGIVLSAMALKQTAKADLEALLPTGNSWTDFRIGSAAHHIGLSLIPWFWETDSALDEWWGSWVFVFERYAAIDLQRVVAAAGPFAGDAQEAIDLLITADHQIAGLAIDDAIAGGGAQWRIDRAQAAFAQAEAAVAAGQFSRAIVYYKRAWYNAVKAV